MASAKGGPGGGPSKGKANGTAAEAQPTSAPKSRRAIPAARPEVLDESSARRSNRRERSPLNSVRPGRPRSPSAREEWQRQNGVRGDEAAQARPRTTQPHQPPDRPESDDWTIPDSVKDGFTQDGRRFYFPDGTPAFRVHARRLTTASENAAVVAAFIEIAKASRVNSIEIRGTERFKQEAWKQGKLAGLEVRGYRANEAERAAMARALSRRADDTRPQELSLTHPPSDSPQPKAVREAKKEESAPRRDEPIVGKLLDHGSDRYEFNPKADFSYFARIETAQGKRVIWGLDLERAMKESLSQPKIGDKVVLQHRGSKPVTVVRREFDVKGTLLNETEVSAKRNSWSIESADFIAQRRHAADSLRDPALSRTLVGQKHPELAGTLLQIKAAELAARRFGDPRDRATFVATVRNALADQVARGEPLRPVQLREPRERRASPERDQTPTR